MAEMRAILDEKGFDVSVLKPAGKGREGGREGAWFILTLTHLRVFQRMTPSFNR